MLSMFSNIIIKALRLAYQSRIFVVAETTLILFSCVLIYLAVYFNGLQTYALLQCPFKTITGLKCFGCGGVHASYFLVHGDIASALISNLFILLYLAIIIYGLAAYVFFRFFKKVLFQNIVGTAKFWIVILSSMVLFMVIRNII